MGQVPKYLIVGDGRVARHFRHYFSLLNIPHTQWDRRQSVDLLPALAADATHILLLIKDSAIDGFALKNTAAVKIHFSGSLVTSNSHGAHPLMTFGAELYTLEKYKAIPFVVDSTAPTFEKILPGLPNQHVRLDPAQKAKYHALCVMAGNFSCLLWQKLFDTLQADFDIPAATAHMYLQQQTENLLADHKTALTGPLARGDMETVARNIKALDGDPFQQIYRSFVTAYSSTKEKAS